MKGLVFLLFFSGAVLAQTSWLVGDWQAETSDGAMTFSFRQDTYTFNFSDTQEPDEGSWSLSGTVLSLESTIYENMDYTLDKVSDDAFNLSGGDLEGTFSFSKQGQQTTNPLSEQGTNGQASTDQAWFLGTWSAVNGVQVVSLTNNPDGTYTFEITDFLNPYREEGTWTLSGDNLTQQWNDPNTGEAASATYRLEKLSDTAFNQSGGNLGETVFSFTKAGGDPLATLEDILSTPSEPTNPLSDLGDTSSGTAQEPQSAQTTTQVTAPPPASDPTVTAEFMVGEWVALENNQIFSFNVRANGTYTWQISTWNGEVTYSEDAQWQLDNGRLQQTWTNAQTGLTETAYYEPERISENSLRWGGGNFALDTVRFDRVVQGQLSPVSGWLVGYWTGIITLDSWGFIFNADGTYTLSVSDFQQNTTAFQGSWKLDKDKLLLTGDKTASYTVAYLDDVSSYFVGEDSGDSSNLFQKINQEPRNPYQLLSFVGQYVQQDYTLSVTHDGAAYSAVMLFKDTLIPYSAVANGDTLQLMDARGQLTYTFRLNTNGLKTDGTFSLNPYWQKISESTLNTPSELLSYWVKTDRFSRDDDLLLLPDGRYRQSTYFELTGQLSGGATEGLYTIEGDQLTLDPQCSGPSTYTIKQVQNHLLLGGSGGFEGDNKLSVITYMAVPATSIDYQLTQAKLRNEIEARINAEWEGKIALAPINTSIGRIPPGGEISADPFPEDIFANATVFAERELYPYTSDYYYVYDTGGNYIQTSLNSQIIENMNPGGFKQDIDFSKGSYYDKLNRYFFPNGRTLQYYESYSTATSIAYPPKPTISYSWSKYKIEDGKIIVGDDAVVYELINGRRHIRFEEECFENLKFSISVIEQ
jgi:hypothetical protein